MATEPLTAWDKKGVPPPELIWSSRLDERYLIEVQRTADSTALLCVFDNDNDLSLIHKEEVTLSFEARFGPDVDDVASWQDTCIDIVDNPDKRSTNE